MGSTSGKRGNGNGNGTGVLNLIQFLTEILEEPIDTQPDKHCMPRLKDGKYDRNDASAYEALRDLRPGVGCGGLRSRLDCGTADTVIPSGQDWNNNSPTLVSTSL